MWREKEKIVWENEREREKHRSRRLFAGKGRMNDLFPLIGMQTYENSILIYDERNVNRKKVVNNNNKGWMKSVNNETLFKYFNYIFFP